MRVDIPFSEAIKSGPHQVNLSYLDFIKGSLARGFTNTSPNDGILDPHFVYYCDEIGINLQVPDWD